MIWCPKPGSCRSGSRGYARRTLKLVAQLHDVARRTVARRRAAHERGRHGRTATCEKRDVVVRLTTGKNERRHVRLAHRAHQIAGPRVGCTADDCNLDRATNGKVRRAE